MDLSAMVLEQMTDERCFEMQKFWYENRSAGKARDSVQITSPLAFANYTALFQEFIRHENAVKISYYHLETAAWRHLPKDRLQREVPEIISHLQELSHRKGHLKLWFDVEQGERIRLSVAEDTPSGILIAYEALFPTRCKEWFSWRSEPEFRFREAYALWVP